MVVVAIVLAVVYIVASRPYKRTMETVELIANGDSTLRVTGKGASELTAFAGYFNTIMEKSNVRDESRQEFVSNVSHELKTPITSIKVLADSLNMQPDAPVELYREFMQDITKEIDRESKIIEDLLSIVRMDKSADSLNIASVNINELIEMVLKRLTPLAEKKNVEILFESFRPVVAEVDEVKITQVVSNLVENAIKYNINDGWVHVSLNADYQYLFIRVEDSGIGIPQQSQDMVFDRFYRVDKARSRETGGTGLGLAIVQQIVVLHHGTIKLYSEEGNGTTFTVRIPLNYVG
jgi:signal transduction histidine kinase